MWVEQPPGAAVLPLGDSACGVLAKAQSSHVRCVCMVSLEQPIGPGQEEWTVQPGTHIPHSRTQAKEQWSSEDCNSLQRHSGGRTRAGQGWPLLWCLQEETCACDISVGPRVPTCVWARSHATAGPASSMADLASGEEGLVPEVETAGLRGAFLHRLALLLCFPICTY